jgi:hypothetical protein
MVLIYGPDDGIGFSDQPGPARSAPMAHLLLIDDDLALTPKQVHQAFPGPAHTVAVASTGAEGVARIFAPVRQTSFCSICACPTSPAWTSTGKSARSTGASRSSS